MLKNEIKNELKNRVAEKTLKRKVRLLYKSKTHPIVEAWEAAGRPFMEEPEAVAYRSRYRVILQFWWEGADLKKEIRSHQLALGYLRGRRYWECERSRAEDNFPNTDEIVRLTGATEAEISDWLTEKPSEEEAAAYQVHLDAAKAKARAAKASYGLAKRAAQCGRAA